MTTATTQPSEPPTPPTPSTPPAVPAAGHTGGALTGALTGTGALTRLALRGDRVRIPAWLLALAVVVAATVSSYQGLYPTVADRVAFAASMNANAAFRALYGHVYGTADVGGIVAWRVLGGGIILAGLMSVFLVVRHTRAEEETGRAELVGATAVGRHAPLTAALLVAALADLGVVVVLTLVLAGGGLPATGALAFGLAVGLNAFAVGALAAVTAQLASTGRAAAGLAGSLLALLFVVAAAGNIADNWLAWATPFGWAHQVRPFGGQRWAPLAPPVLLAAALITVAHALVARRDQGAALGALGALVADRPGPPAAPAWLAGPFGLAWRLQRATLATWAAGAAAYGLLLGAIATDIGDFTDSSGQFNDILQRLGGTTNLVDAFLAAIVSLLALVTAGYAIHAVLRVRAEETAGHAEAVLAGATSRAAWAGAHLVVTALGTVAILVLVGLTTGLVHGARTGDVTGTTGHLVAATLAQVPAVWVLLGLTFALVGLLPRLTWLAWAAFACCVGIAEVGGLADLPHWVVDLNPFGHVTGYPLTRVPAAAIAWLLAVAAALTAAGFAGLRRRDIG